MPGRERKSIEFSRKLGTAQAQRVSGRSDATPGSEPVAPAHLTKAGAKIWELIVPDLVEANMATKLDSLTITQYCEAYALWQRESRRRKNRDEALVRQWFDRALKLSDQLGLSIRARTSITVPASQADDRLDELVA